MHSLEIKDVSVIATEDGEQISVEVEIDDGENTVLRRFGFPLGTSQEEIEADLKNVVAGLDSDAAHQKGIAEHDEKMKKVDEMREALKGKNFTDSGKKSEEAKQSE